MTRYCVIDALKAEWVVTSGLDEQECGRQGGVVVNRPGSSPGCASQAASAHSFQALAESGTSGPASALALVPARMFREKFSDSLLVAQLNRLNTLSAEEITDIFETDPALSQKIRNAFFSVSLLVASLLLDTRDEYSNLSYASELHERLVEIADEVVRRTSDDEFRAALRQVVETVGQFSGKSLLEISVALTQIRPERSES